MLSILIPTYDHTCYKLVEDLHRQAEELGVNYEILVQDDGSRDQVSIIANNKINDLPNCRYIRRRENHGRAAIRNELARLAQYDWLIFIDNDARVDNPDYLRNYLAAVGKADVIVGGLHHPAVNYDKSRSLRFKYETLADQHRSAVERQLRPYEQLTCFNIMIRRSVFLCILFDEDCREYGYEDVLFGQELQRRGISILHTDNTLEHTGIDTNEEFIHKTETALRTLASLGDKIQDSSRIATIQRRLQRMKLTSLFADAYIVCGGLIRRQLLSANPSLRLFSLYKLCYLCWYINRKDVV